MFRWGAVNCSFAFEWLFIVSAWWDLSGTEFLQRLKLSFGVVGLSCLVLTTFPLWDLAFVSSLQNPAQSDVSDLDHKGQDSLEKRGERMKEKDMGCYFKKTLKRVRGVLVSLPFSLWKAVPGCFSWISGGNSTNTIRCFVCEQVYLSKSTQWLIVIFHLIHNLYWHLELLQFLRVTS